MSDIEAGQGRERDDVRLASEQKCVVARACSSIVQTYYLLAGPGPACQHSDRGRRAKAREFHSRWRTVMVIRICLPLSTDKGWQCSSRTAAATLIIHGSIGVSGSERCWPSPCTLVQYGAAGRSNLEFKPGEQPDSSLVQTDRVSSNVCVSHSVGFVAQIRAPVGPEDREGPGTCSLGLFPSSQGPNRPSAHPRLSRPNVVAVQKRKRRAERSVYK